MRRVDARRSVCNDVQVSRLPSTLGRGFAFSIIGAGLATLLMGCTEVIRLVWPTSAPILVPGSIHATYRGDGAVSIAAAEKVVEGKVWLDETISFQVHDPESGPFTREYDNPRPSHSEALSPEGRFAPFSMGSSESPISTRDVILARSWVRGFGSPYFSPWATISIQ